MPLKIFTTRPDTIFGVSFLALAHNSAKLKELLHADEGNWID
jgi:leucyl-tRNA synthetase